MSCRCFALCGLVKHDLPNVLQRLVPDDARYEHEATWNDDNGHSHIRAAFIGPSVTIPFSKVSYLPPTFLKTTTLRGSSSMRHE